VLFKFWNLDLDHRILFFSFLFSFSSPFTFFQSLFSPLHAYFLCLLSYCCLIILLCFVLPQVVASSPCHVVSLHCLIIVSLVLHCIDSLCCLITLPHASSHYLFRLVTLPYSFASLPHHVGFSLLYVVSLLHVLPIYLIALAGYLTLLPWLAAFKVLYEPPPPHLLHYLVFHCLTTLLVGMSLLLLVL
jgi:hypothetical protein